MKRALGRRARNFPFCFLHRLERKRIPDLLRIAANSPLLTVSDCDGFAASGGVIGFMTIDDRVRFQINNAAATHAGLLGQLQTSGTRVELARSKAMIRLRNVSITTKLTGMVALAASVLFPLASSGL